MVTDGVKVTGKMNAGPEFQTVVKYAQLDPDYSFLIHSNPIRTTCSSIAALLGAFVCFAFFKRDGSLDDRWIIMIAVMSAVLAMVAFYNSQRQKIAQFTNKNGLVILEVCGSGPESENFQRFIDEISKNIRAATSAQELQH